MRLLHSSVPVTAIALLLAGCKMPGEKQDFGAIEEEFVYGSLALSPVSATSAGYHEHKGKRLDEMLDDFTPSGIAEQRRFYLDFHNRLDVIKPESLSSEERADYQLMEDQIQLALMEIQQPQLNTGLVAPTQSFMVWIHSRSCSVHGNL